MAPEKKQKRRRARRTEDFSSDSDSSSEDEVKPVVETGHSDNDENEPQLELDLDQPVAEWETESSNPRVSLSEDLALDVSNEQAFRKHYMELVTTQYAEDLNQLRQSKDFHDQSLDLLVQALQAGQNLFSRADRDVLTGRKL